MPLSEIDSLKARWLSEEQLKLLGSGRKRKKRQYLHFDHRITNLTADNVADAWNPEAVRKHGFYPFLRWVDVKKRYKRVGGVKRRTKKKRPICYASHFDAIIYSWYATLLDPPYERMLRASGLEDNVIAYRELGKDNIDFAKEAFDFILSREESAVICIDLENFFDSLDHEILKDRWRELYSDEDGRLPADHFAVFKAITEYSYVDRGKLLKRLGMDSKQAWRIPKIDFPVLRSKIAPLIRRNVPKGTKGFGIPQGAPISDVLSNLYMVGFDRALAEAVNKRGAFYRRYCDDVLIVCDPKYAEEMHAVVLAEVAKLGPMLKVNPAKTELRLFSKSPSGFSCSDLLSGKASRMQYLGMEFDGQEITLRRRGHDAFRSRMARVARGAVFASMKMGSAIPKRMLYSKFTALSKWNFLEYAQKAADKTGSARIQKMASKKSSIRAIKKQIARARKKLGV